MGRRVVLRVEHHLGDALSVAQIDEDEPPVIPAPEDPAHENDRLVHVRGREGVAVVGLVPFPEGIQRDRGWRLGLFLAR